jgi:hypothetical protein
MADVTMRSPEQLEMYSVIHDRLEWQLDDARIHPMDDGSYIVCPQRRILAKQSWSQIFASSMRDSGYTVEYLPDWWGAPAVRISH